MYSRFCTSRKGWRVLETNAELIVLSAGQASNLVRKEADVGGNMDSLIVDKQKCGVVYILVEYLCAASQLHVSIDFKMISVMRLQSHLLDSEDFSR
jgi:hypothetical protein